MAKVLDGTAACTVKTLISLDPKSRHFEAGRFVLILGVDFRTLRSSKVDDIPVRLEHVDLLNCLDRLNIELLQRRLQLLVIHSGALVYLLDLSSWCAFSTIRNLSACPDRPLARPSHLQFPVIVF